MSLLIASRMREAAWQLGAEYAEKGLKDWHELRSKWASLGKVVATFFSPGNGLPAPDRQDWFALKIFEVPDMATVEKMNMAYFRSEISANVECKFIVGAPDGLEKEWLEKQNS